MRPILVPTVDSTQKNTRIEGDLVRNEVLDSAKNILTPTIFGGQKGVQQFFSPPQVVNLIRSVYHGRDGCALDPTAGNGMLLSAFSEKNRFGIEIDGDQIDAAEETNNQKYDAIKGDVQQVFPLVEQVVNRFGFIVANPPFGLRWSDPSVEDGKEMTSARLTFQYLKRMLAEDGEWFFLCGADQFDREIRELAEQFGLYATVRVDDLGKDSGFAHPCTFAFGVHPNELLHPEEIETRTIHRDCPLDMVDLLTQWVKDQREHVAGYLGRYAGDRPWGGEIERQWAAARAEYKRRSDGKKAKKDDDAPDFHVSLWGGDRVQVHLDAFTRMVLHQKQHATSVVDCDNVNINYFVLNERSWILIKQLADELTITLDPKLVAKVEPMIEESRKDAVPLYNLAPAQRLGFLTDLDQIKCIKTCPERNFEEGKWYPLRTGTRTQVVYEQKPHQIRTGKRAGEIEIRDYEVSYAVMWIKVGNYSFTDSQRTEDQFDIQWLIDHFEIRDPGDVADKYPDEINAELALIDSIQDEYFKPRGLALKEFQRQDIARLAWKKRGLLAWEQGLGKTIAGAVFAKAMIKKGAKEQVLVVCPLDLIPQWRREMKKFFGIEMTVIDGTGYGVKRGPAKPGGKDRVLKKCIQAQAHDISKKLGTGATGWFITHYEGLTTNGTNLSDEEGVVVVYEKPEWKRIKGTGMYGSYGMLPHPNNAERQIRVALELCPPGTEKAGYGYIPEETQQVMKEVTSKTVCPKCHSDYRNGWNGKACSATLKDGSTCDYVHFKHRVRPAASYLSGAFRQGVLILDEATYIQGDTAKRSLALRGVNARHTLLMTGTPIKNYIRQAFWPLWKSLGNATQGFSYDYANGYQKFESHFAVWEQYRVGRGNKSAKKARPEITNLSKFWRLLSPSAIRRRKEDTGETIVPRKFHVVNVNLGVSQQAQLNGWLKHFPDWFIATHPESNITSRATAELMAPMIGLQQKIDWISTMPEGDTGGIDWLNENKGLDIDPSNYTPANLRVLELAMALAKQGRKVLVGCNLKVAGRWYAERLTEKGVKAQHILDESDSTMSASERAAVVHAFQENDTQVLCAGIKAIRLGHNLDAGSAVIINGLEWDFESYDQFIARIHRLTSTVPVDVYVIIPKGSITEKKWRTLGLKASSSQLALDGRLIEEQKEQVSESKVIAEMMERGIPITGDEVDEQDIRDSWDNYPQIDSWKVPAGLLTDEDVEFTDFDAEPTSESEEPHPWTVWSSVFGDGKEPLALPAVGRTSEFKGYQEGVYFGGILVGWKGDQEESVDVEEMLNAPTPQESSPDESTAEDDEPTEMDEWEMQLTLLNG